ncbi:MAG: hypothetical protein Q4F17_12180 [Eubacteriales bacterium]|nr:hypothetical protein [Eubacteriales bacterium]
MDDLMARTMVENLILGINPLTGRALSKGDICNNPVVQEALRTVLENCTIDSYATMLRKQRQEKKEAKEQREEKRRIQYPQTGEPWSKEEDAKLQALFKTRYDISRIAIIMQRTPDAVRNRLKKLGYRV